MNRYQIVLWAVVAATMALSWIHAPYPDQMYLQHIPTVAALVAWPFLARRFPLSDSAVSCLAAFLLLHVLGARYIYSYVPYDRWTQHLFGFEITRRFGFRRNHFDRVVHFAFGALWVRPVWEVCVRYLRLPRRFAYYTAFEFVLAFSMLYELVEWGLSLALAGQDADAYNGQQGDIWDAQKDMSCALLGAVIALAVLWITRRNRIPVPGSCDMKVPVASFLVAVGFEAAWFSVIHADRFGPCGPGTIWGVLALLTYPLNAPAFFTARSLLHTESEPVIAVLGVALVTGYGILFARAYRRLRDCRTLR